MNELDEKINELIDKYRADIILSARGMASENQQYKDSAINVGALASINTKTELKALISEQTRLARIDELENLHDRFYHVEKSQAIVAVKMRLDRLIEG